MILDSEGREFYELRDLALLWGDVFARHVWDIVITGHLSWVGLNERNGKVGHLPTGTTTTGYDALVPAASWPGILSAAVRIADQEGIA